MYFLLLPHIVFSAFGPSCISSRVIYQLSCYPFVVTCPLQAFIKDKCTIFENFEEECKHEYVTVEQPPVIAQRPHSRPHASE